MQRSKSTFLLAVTAALLAIAVTVTPAAHAAPAAAANAKSTEAAAPVDLNTAGIEQLMAIPGIGKSLAQRIVTFREKNGAFTKVDDLLKVQGVGEKSIEKLRPYVTASSKSAK